MSEDIGSGITCGNEDRCTYMRRNRQTNKRLIERDPWIADDVTRGDANGKRRGELTLTSTSLRVARQKSEPG